MWRKSFLTTKYFTESSKVQNVENFPELEVLFDNKLQYNSHIELSFNKLSALLYKTLVERIPRSIHSKEIIYVVG